MDRDILVGFVFSDYVQEVDGSIFIGYTRPDGSVLIKKYASGNMSYFYAISDYAAHWTDRVNLTFAPFNEVF